MTDRASTNDPLTRAMISVFRNLISRLMVCMPGTVTAFNPDDQTAQIQCAIQGVGADGVGVNLPVIDNVPVHFPGDTHYLWHAIEPGCEGLVMFSQRSIEEWLDRGGPVAPADSRMFSLSDAFFIPGTRSRANKIPGFKNSGAGISDKAGDNYVWLDGSDLKAKAASIDAQATGAVTVQGATVEATATASCSITAPVINLNGLVNVSGLLTMAAGMAVTSGGAEITGPMTNNGVNVGNTHTHPQAPDSRGDTQSNTGTPS